MTWEIVHDGTTSVRRMKITGGWLYQVEMRESVSVAFGDTSTRSGWHPPVFVPDGGK